MKYRNLSTNLADVKKRRERVFRGSLKLGFMKPMIVYLPNGMAAIGLL
jgi:hypothetical protein